MIDTTSSKRVPMRKCHPFCYPPRTSNSPTATRFCSTASRSRSPRARRSVLSDATAAGKRAFSKFWPGSQRRTPATSRGGAGCASGICRRSSSWTAQNLCSKTSRQARRTLSKRSGDTRPGTGTTTNSPTCSNSSSMPTDGTCRRESKRKRARWPPLRSILWSGRSRAEKSAASHSAGHWPRSRIFSSSTSRRTTSTPRRSAGSKTSCANFPAR